jgi:SAM-dependent methyltransferase
MTHPSPSERAQGYVFSGDDADLRRLLVIAEAFTGIARTALARTGVGSGASASASASAIDCGCGPVGALLVLADLVGPTGRVVGLDMNPAAAAQARALVAALGLGNVEVITGDLNEMDPADLGGPFDLAYTRLFLMHQADPVRTLRQIGGALKPGGVAVAQEPLRHPSPRSLPPRDVLHRFWQLAIDVIEGTGVPPFTVENLPESAVAAGLEVEGLDGSVVFDREPGRMAMIYAASFASARDNAIAKGLATAAQLDEIMTGLRDVARDDLRWVSSPLFYDLLLRKPA